MHKGFLFWAAPQKIWQGAMCPKEGGPAAEASENGALLGRAELRGMLDLEEKAERTIIIASDMLMCHDVEKGLCLILLFQSCKKKVGRRSSN